MKKILLAITTVLFTITMATGAMAEQKEQVDVFRDNKLVKSVVFIQGQNEYYVDGKTPGIKMDAAPYETQGRTFVPVRYLGNALGVTDKNISWDTKTNKAKLVLNDKSAELTIGLKQILASGQSKTVDAAPELKNNRTYLPARFVAEALGFDVTFVNGMVLCWPTGETQPDISGLTQAVNSKNLNGYTVPNNPSVLVKDSPDSNIEINIAIVIPKGELEKQFTEAEQILASKLGADLAKKVVDTARQKTDIKKQLYADFNGPNGEYVDIVSGWGNPLTGITVYGEKEGN